MIKIEYELYIDSRKWFARGIITFTGDMGFGSTALFRARGDGFGGKRDKAQAKAMASCRVEVSHKLDDIRREIDKHLFDVNGLIRLDEMGVQS